MVEENMKQVHPFFMDEPMTMSDQVIQESFQPPTASPSEFISEFQLPVVNYDTNEQVMMSPKIQDYLENPPLFQKMIDRIDAVDAYSWARGEMGGLDWGVDKFNEAFEGLNPGMQVFAGDSNIGKSGFMMWLGWKIAWANREITDTHKYKAFVLMFSLDDTCNELMPRLVALDQGIKINAVAKPKKYEHLTEVMAKREQGFKHLKDSVQNYAMIDANEGTSLEHIGRTMDAYYQMLETLYPGEYKLVAVVDNFHDVSIEERGFMEENARIDKVATTLNDYAVKYDAPILCTAEFKKKETFRRPTLTDLKGSAKLLYEAKSVVLCHNDVSLKQEQAEVYWTVEKDGEETKMPIYECNVAKNKFASFKGKVFYRFIPDQSMFTLVDDDEAIKYTQAMSN